MFRRVHQTKYRFAYNKNEIDIDKNYSVNINDAEIKEILGQLFMKDNINYVIIDRQIILSPTYETSGTSQQQKSISGKVTDSSGASLPGVSVVVKGTTTGVITDADGKYVVVKVPEDAILQFSFVGMKSQEVAVGTKTNLNVMLTEETIGIEEVVAVGYGTMKKSDITGSVTSVNSKDFVKGVATNALQLLSGKASGVNISQANSEPGGALNISIRGAGSINSSNSVLVVIDGLPGGNTANINPSDIESIEILKDASAAAIYGTRAANGVVLITTKKGKEGTTQISFNTYAAYQIPFI